MVRGNIVFQPYVLFPFCAFEVGDTILPSEALLIVEWRRTHLVQRRNTFNSELLRSFPWPRTTATYLCGMCRNGVAVQTRYLAPFSVVNPQEESANDMRAQNEIQQRQVATMEATFARIRQATGVNTLEEVVLKLANQSANHTTLEEEKREAESKLTRAKEARQSEDTRFSYMKASGVGNTELNRDISDKLNDDIQEYRVEVRSCGL